MANIITKTERAYLLKSMKSLLDEYNYQYREAALNDIIDKWASEKAPLIKAFKKHPNYLKGKFMISFDMDYERTIDTQAVRYFKDWLLDIPVVMYKDDIPDDIKRRKGYWDAYLPSRLYNFFDDLVCYPDKTISECTADILADIIPEVRVAPGQKTSRAINKICHYLGYDKHPDYNREYAKFADALSPMIIKRHTLLSINPLDYLTMSFGNSWASCHTIDKKNIRNMPDSYSGTYSAGTISYMLDGSSMVFYTVHSDYVGTEYWAQPKINRQMFHWGEDKLVQGRLYPQSNDGDGSAYAPYRQIVQEIMSIIFDFPNLWTVKSGTGESYRYIISRGTHYRDYNSYDSCTTSRVAQSRNEKKFIVGAEPICIECGSIHMESENINHCVEIGKEYICSVCGRHINEREMVADMATGVIYCDDCHNNINA